MMIPTAPTLQRRIIALWDGHKDAEPSERVMLAQAFIDNEDPAALRARTLIHPQIRRKDYLTKVSALTILADFIIMAAMIDERHNREYPVSNAERWFEREQVRARREMPIEWEDEDGEQAGPITTVGEDGRDYSLPVRKYEEREDRGGDERKPGPVIVRRVRPDVIARYLKIYYKI